MTFDTEFYKAYVISLYILSAGCITIFLKFEKERLTNFTITYNGVRVGIMETATVSNDQRALNVVLAEQQLAEYIIESYSPNETNGKGSEMASHAEKTVINVQPQRNGGSQLRHPFPISSVKWQTLDVRQLNPQWGLQLLADIEQVLIQQTVELDQLLSAIESENRYVVKVPEGMTLFVGAEYSSAWQRLCCGSSRAFTLHLLDPSKQEALMMVRRLAGTVGCYVQRIEVYIPSGVYIGCIKQETTLIVPNFIVKNSNGNILFTIEGPKCCTCFMYTEANFQVKSTTDNQLASISHSWQERLNSYGLSVTFPARNTDPRTKALLIAAGFLLEYMFFEKVNSRRCLGCIKC